MIGTAVAGLAAAGLAAHGAWHRNSAVFGPVLTRLPGDEPLVSITFAGRRSVTLCVMTSGSPRVRAVTLSS